MSLHRMAGYSSRRSLAIVISIPIITGFGITIKVQTTTVDGGMGNDGTVDQNGIGGETISGTGRIMSEGTSVELIMSVRDVIEVGAARPSGEMKIITNDVPEAGNVRYDKFRPLWVRYPSDACKR